MVAWLQGGPFLEVSFIIKFNDEKKEVIKAILKKLTNLHHQIEVVDTNLVEMLESFDKGYPYDEEDPHSVYKHSMHVNLYVSVAGRRKSTLQIEQVSSSALLINFWFFGSEFDAPEWGQIGIKGEDLSDFKNFLIDLFYNFKFKIGGVAIEEDVLGLYDCDEARPNECYCFEYIKPQQLLKNTPYFIDILWNEGYGKLGDTIPYYHKRINDSGLLISISNSYSEF
ncbi:MAG: hypothetical protein ACK4M9_21150 [Anaerobacillus sp.]|uniref:hypothetical protein n=1 Tax=Anaerobacillus sp. TaxID=1872506 RepID=UPI00391B9C77